MQLDSKIYVAGHRGLVGSALVRNLLAKGYKNILERTHAELDLTDQAATERFFKAEKPEYVFLAAAQVGGIHANNTYPAEFIRNNLAIQSNVIHSAYLSQVRRLIFLGSSCIYPKLAPQPLKEEYLLMGALEETNRPYALAKIAGIEMCWSYNRQYRTQYLAVMPTNLYGPGDNYHLENSHVIPAMIRKFHEAKISNDHSVSIWGTGTPRREFLYSDDMADACVHLINLPDYFYQPLLASNRNDGLPPVINIGVGKDISIRELAILVKETIGYEGEIVYDLTRQDGTPRKLMDIRRLDASGWQAKTDLMTGLSEAYKDFCGLDVSYYNDQLLGVSFPLT